MQVNTLRVVIELESAEGIHAMELARQLSATDFYVDSDFGVVPMYGESEEQGSSVFVRGRVSAERLSELSSLNEVRNVWLDSSIDLFAAPALFCPIKPCDCDFLSKGKARHVVRELGVDEIWKAGFLGQGITIGVVDSGIEAQGKVPSGGLPNVVGGYPADWGTKSIHLHGNMVAFNILQVAPRVALYDFRISDVGGGDFISNAAKVFDLAIASYRQHGTPQILNCSWGINRSASDPVYAADPNHFFTRKVREAVHEGIAVVFSAGNCGPACPLSVCGSEYGPGCIWGANGSPEVMTVGAVNIDDRLVGYSGCGPAALNPEKPDFCGYSEFKSYFPSGDFGTSVASPLVAGVVALLKSKKPSLGPSQAKAALQQTARQIGGLSGWNAFSGYGVVDAWAAFQIV